MPGQERSSQDRITRAAYLARRKRRGIPITYRRGDDSVELTAVVGQTATSLAIDEAGSQVRGSIRDYLVLPEDLVLDGAVTKPRPGDRITDPDGVVLEVARLAGEPGWRWSDPGRQVVRIHTQEIGGS